MSGEAREQVRFGAFRLHTECEHCGERLAVNGPIRRLSCAACGRENRIELEVITALLADFEDGGQQLTVGQSHGGRLDAGRSFTWRYTHCTPRCRHCGADSVAAEMAADSAEPELRCGRCGERFSVWPVPAWLKITVPSAVRVIGPPPPVDGESAPVAMDCPGCGRDLDLSGTHARISPCGYCGQEIFLPESVWSTLHPPSRVRDWYVQFEGPTAEELRGLEILKEIRSARERKHRERERGAGSRRRVRLIGAAMAVALALGLIWSIWVITGSPAPIQ